MNRRNILLIFPLVILVIILVSSCASHRYTRKAVKFEDAGLFADAADYYYEAVKKKASNVDAKLGLRKTGQQTVDIKLKAVKDAYKQTDYEDVVYYYLAAERYKDKLSSVGVTLTFPEIYESYYDEAKNDYLSTLYSSGLEKLNREEFNAAQKIFQEIKSVEPSYKDVSEKYTIAKYEPVYRDANAYFENDMYRRAYFAYDEILRETGNYKQALSLKNEAREKGTITILVTDFGFSHQSYIQTANVITSSVKARLIAMNNPFVRIIDAESVRERIYKNGKINRQAASLLGIKAILSGNVLHIQKSKGKLKKEIKKGYLKEYKTVINNEGKSVRVPDYKKTEYIQYKLANSAKLHIDFSLVSTENGEVIVSEIYKLTNTDEVNYAKFNGDKNKLVPGYWRSKSSSSEQDIVKDNYSDKKALKVLLNARKSPKTVSVLVGELSDESAQKIVNKIDDYNPE